MNIYPGQRFLSQSKVQSHPVEYIYRGQKKDRTHLIEGAGDNHGNDWNVDPEWFDNRKIKLLTS